MSERRMTRLGDMADFQIGYAFKSADFSDNGGVRLLRGDNIAQGTTKWDRTEYWANGLPVESRYVLKSGDVVLAMDRPWIGAGLKYATVQDGDLPAYLVQRVARLRGAAGTNQRYLGYIVGSPDFTNYILTVQTGTSIPHISGKQIADYAVAVHTEQDQQRIAEVLGALDDKIAANHKLVESIDSLARAQFHAALHDAQPRPLSSLAEFVNGKAFTKGASGTGRVVIRIAELNSGIGGSTVFSDIAVDDKHVARPGDILFAWSGSLTLHRWFREEAIVNQHIFKVIPNVETPNWLIYEILRNKLEDFKMIAADKATTMGHIQRKHLDEQVRVPDMSHQQEIASDMDSLWQTALNTERENLALVATRDALLPQLMSGILRVKDAENLVAAAL